MATIIERMMLVNLDGHASQGGLDLIRYSIRNSKGLAGALRRNKMIPLISQMDAFCDEILREIPGYASATKCESFCIHCMQDHRVGVRTPTFGDNHSDTVFLMQANNCDYHRFYGRSDAEERILQCRRSFPFAPDRLRTPSSERLPFAFVHVDKVLLGHCMNQLIRQSTREDTAALADCYAFGVRSVEGLRNCSEPAEVLKLHLMVAARLKWLPCTLAEVHDWVPTTPFDSSAFYRRPKTLGDVVMQDEYVRRPLAELFGQEPHFAVQPVDWPLEYGYVEGVPEWIRDLQQHNPGMLYDTDGVLGPGAPGRPDFYLEEPEDELDACHVDIEDVRPGKNGMRATDNPETADDRVYRVVRNQEGLCAKEIIAKGAVSPRSKQIWLCTGSRGRNS